MLRCRKTWLVIAALSSVTARARAQVKLGTVEVEAERAADDPERPEADAPPFVTVVDARSPTARTASVAELVEREAGVHVRSTGGQGAFTAVSIRGAQPNEVAVFLDGVPLNHASAAAVDLALLPADALERIEVYRGVPPVELGSQAVGGAINIVTRRASGAPSLRASVGGGSFGARAASLGWGGASGGLRWDASAAYRGATGDFTYYDNNGTLLETRDDRFTTRKNDGFDQAALDVTLARDGRRSFRLASHGFLKLQGVPSLAGAGGETQTASLTTGRLVTDGAVEQRDLFGPAIDGRLAGYLAYERTIFKNPRGEPAGSQGPVVTDGETVAAGASARVLAAAGAHELWTLLASLDAERYAPRDLLNPAGAPGPSTRVRAAFALADDLRFFDDRLALAPSLRLDGVASDLARAVNFGGRNAAGGRGNDVFFSPRFGARFRVAPWLTVKGSLGRFVRLPSTVELFGDGAFVLPRPSLRPETAWSGDLGALVTRKWFELEVSLFGRFVSDYITLIPAGYGFGAINVGDERFLGVEARGRIHLGRFLAASLDYTFLHTFNAAGGVFDGAEGKELPGVPQHKLAARLDLSDGPYRIWYEALYTGDTWRDAENTPGALVPARVLHSLGASAGPWRRLPIALTVELRNAADLRVVRLPLNGLIHGSGATTPYPLVDVLDYPLPGRALYATLTYHR